MGGRVSVRITMCGSGKVRTAKDADISKTREYTFWRGRCELSHGGEGTR
jgi:hypothetical protein